jgi:hypothetical protein
MSAGSMNVILGLSALVEATVFHVKRERFVDKDMGVVWPRSIIVRVSLGSSSH